MAGKASQRVRLLQLIRILEQKTDEAHPLSAADFIRLLSEQSITCDRKTIYDDLEALILCGYDIVQTSQPKKGYFLSGREFELPEVSLLTDAVLSADFITRKKTGQLVKKLEGLLNEYQAEAYARRSFIENRDKCENEEIYYNIDALERAVQEKCKVSLSYLRHRLGENGRLAETSRKMTVSPYALVWADDHYYLICNYEKYDNLMHLRLDRMKSVQLLDEPFRHFSEVCEYREEFNVAEYTRKTFLMFSGAEKEVVFDCSADILEQVVDRFGDQIYIRPLEENTFRFVCKACVSDGLVSWIMQFKSKIEVKSPAGLRDKVALAANEIAAIYRPR